jgi:hypothetical protein
MVPCTQLRVRVGVNLFETVCGVLTVVLFTVPSLLCFGLREWKGPQGSADSGEGLQSEHVKILCCRDHAGPAVFTWVRNFASVSALLSFLSFYFWVGEGGSQCGNHFQQVCILFTFSAGNHLWTLYITHHNCGYKPVVLYDIFMHDVPNFTEWRVFKYFHSYFVFLFSRDEEARGGVVVKALCYKPAGCGFNSRWCHWNFSVT